MPTRRLYSITFILTLLLSCKDVLEKENIDSSSDQVSLNTIIIQPFTDFSSKDVQYIHQEFSKIFPLIKTKKQIDFPKTSFYSPRNRFRADSLINYLQTQTANGHITIGLTNKDISMTKGKYNDYGIMGLGFRPGKACVVSTFRLSPQNKLNQLLKLSLHELGHTQGLPHCATTTCYMRDAEGENHFDEETGFCVSCKNYLILKGWRLND